MTSHPDFTGVWEVDFARSKLEIDAPESSVFTLRHDDPHLSLARTHRAPGYEDTFALELLTDGRESVTHKGEAEIRSTCVWDGPALRFHSTIRAGTVEAENLVVYRLSTDGQEIVAHETFTGPPRSYHNTWVLVRRAER